MSTRVTVTADWEGSQPAPYQGDLWSGSIEFEQLNGLGEWEPWPAVPVNTVRRWVQFLTHFADDDDHTDWFVPRLKHLAPMPDVPHIYEYRVERPYDD